MNIVFFSHPVFLGSISTQRYSKWLMEGMKQRGHHVQLWIPEPKCFNLPVSQKFKKWLGYIDQYVLFPYWVKKQIKKQPAGTLFVLTDHSLGVLAPLIKDQLHIVHCHDFLAQFSAMNEIPENPISWSGRKYQAFIRNGFREAKNFISISEKTREDLHQLMGARPAFSEVVYNGLVHPYVPAENTGDILSFMQHATGVDMQNGYLLHVGGNQWNKNRKGVIEIFCKWCENPANVMPLLMVGPKPDDVIMAAFQKSAFRERIHFLIDKTDEFVELAYQGAAAFVFPSLAEGFGWPIAEAMASGVPVITTSEMPMTEVAGNAALFIELRPFDEQEAAIWADNSAKVLEKLLSYSPEERKQLIANGLQNVKRFDSEVTIAKFEKMYQAVAGHTIENVPLNHNSDVSA